MPAAHTPLYAAVVPLRALAATLTVAAGVIALGTRDCGAPADVSLADELALARAYVAIEAERFRDRLLVRWEVDGAPADARVPDLVVQPLVENALRHGLWPRPGGGTRATVTLPLRRPPAAREAAA